MMKWSEFPCVSEGIQVLGDACAIIGFDREDMKQTILTGLGICADESKARGPPDALPKRR